MSPVMNRLRRRAARRAPAPDRSSRSTDRSSDDYAPYNYDYTPFIERRVVPLSTGGEPPLMFSVAPHVTPPEEGRAAPGREPSH
ncbi:hypothetical protein GCM10023088_76580 [Actinomadura verrucosospora]